MTNTLLLFTDTAVNYIQKIMEERSGSRGFRVAVKETGCSGLTYVFEIVTEPHAADVHFKAQQDLSVYVDAACISFIKGSTVDFVKKGLGSQLVFRDNPNAQGSCGCGESFTVK